MDKVPSFGTAIRESAGPTMEAYAPLLKANESAIRSTTVKTFTYGPHPRQELDVYYPPYSNSFASVASHSQQQTRLPPVLIFLHPGGLAAGSKEVPVLPGNSDDIPPWLPGLAYANVGHFFASTAGFVVIVANYRLDRHGAIFPSGGEDLSLTIQWIQRNLATGKLGSDSAAVGQRDLFLSGTSAGGIHVLTYLFHENFAEQRKSLMLEKSPLALRAVVSLSGPMDLANVPPHRVEVLARYFKGDIRGNMPQGMINRIIKEGGDLVPGVRLLITVSEYDSPDEVKEASMVAVGMLNQHRHTDLLFIPGHNHFSLLYALGTGIDREEAWGQTLMRWLMM